MSTRLLHKSSEFPAYLAGAQALVWAEGGEGEVPRLLARVGSAGAGSRADFDALEEAVLLADDRRRYVDANAAACRLTGYSLSELLSLGIDELSAPSSGPSASATWGRFQRQGSQIGHYSLKSKDGSVRQVSYEAWTNILPGYHLSLLRPL